MAVSAAELFAQPGELPYNLEAEQSVIAAMLIDAGCVPTVIGYLKPESFYRAQHKEIYAIVMRMFVSSQAIDFVTVLDEVCKEDIFPTDADAKIYLTQLVKTLPTTANVEDYARIVRDKYFLRSMVSTFEQVIEASREGSTSPETLMDLAEQGIYDIRRGKETSGFKRIDEVLSLTYDRLQRLGGEDKADYLGISTGFRLLDSMTTGLNRSDLIVLAARPGMGKTAFALNIATNVAAQEKTVAIFSLEMSNEQLAERLLSAEAMVHCERMKRGNLTAEDWNGIAYATQKLAKMPIYLNDSASVTIGEMKGKLRRLKDVSLVVIDYLQLMSSGSKNSGNRVQEVSEMTRSLKIMAKEFNIPVIVLSQLSRGPEARTDKRPMLSDLRESGSIEQDADLVWFLYRDSYYNPQSELPGIAECIIAKNRHGDVGSVGLGWSGQFTKFSNAELAMDDE